MKVLETVNIRKEFGTLVAVKDVNLSIDRGQILGLIGPNGAGKTTLLRILATLLRPTDGKVQVLDHDVKKDYLEIRKRIGYLPDFFGLYSDLTLEECLEFFAKAYAVDPALISKKVDEVLQFVELEEKRTDFIRHLSRGMVQRLGVAVLLVHDPDILLLDEPASGLDPKARIQLRVILKKLSEQGKTVIISSHILTELSGFCSHIAIMNKGDMVLYGAVDDIQRKMAATRKLRISVLDDRDRAVEILKEFPEMDIIAVDNQKITVELSGGVDEVAKLNTHLVQQGIRVVGFSEELADLEDVFMKISADQN